MENTLPPIDLQAAWEAGLLPQLSRLWPANAVPQIRTRPAPPDLKARIERAILARRAPPAKRDAKIIATIRRHVAAMGGRAWSFHSFKKTMGWHGPDAIARLHRLQADGHLRFERERDYLTIWVEPAPEPAPEVSSEFSEISRVANATESVANTTPENAPDTAPAPMNGCEYHPAPHDYDPEAASAALAETGDPLDGLPFFDSDDVQLRAQCGAFRKVWKRCRDLGEDLPFIPWARNLGIDLKTVYDRFERGTKLASRYTREDDEYFRSTFGKFLPIVPHGETGPECERRRRAFKNARAKEDTMEQQQAYTRPDLPQPIAGKITPTVDHAGRLAALRDVVPVPPGTTTIARVARKLRRQPAWRGPNGELLDLGYLEKAIGRLIRAHPSMFGATLTPALPWPVLHIWRR